MPVTVCTPPRQLSALLRTQVPPLPEFAGSSVYPAGQVHVLPLAVPPSQNDDDRRGGDGAAAAGRRRGDRGRSNGRRRGRLIAWRRRELTGLACGWCCPAPALRRRLRHETPARGSTGCPGPIARSRSAGASSTPQIERATKVERRATTKSLGSSNNATRWQMVVRNGRSIAQSAPAWGTADIDNSSCFDRFAPLGHSRVNRRLTH